MKRSMILFTVVAVCACADDAPPPTTTSAPPPPGVELTSAGGRLTSASYSLEVQVGHAVEQQPAASAAHRLEPHTVIKP